MVCFRLLQVSWQKVFIPDISLQFSERIIPYIRFFLRVTDQTTLKETDKIGSEQSAWNCVSTFTNEISIQNKLPIMILNL
jgi:hypothetical protein